MNTTNFKKPDLFIYFAGLPPEGVWMQSEYENATNLNQCVKVMHNWFNIAEETNDLLKKQCYENGANLLKYLLEVKN